MSSNITKTFRYDGKRYYIRAKDEKEAIMKMANKIRDLEEHRITVSGNMTVEEWSYRAVKSYKTNLKDITKKKYIDRLNHCVLEDIGKMRLRDVKPIHCQACLNKQEGKSKAQIDLVYQCLQFVFRTACENELILKSPAEHLTRPKGYVNTRREITRLEQEHLIKACSKFDNGDLFLFMLYCGCRPSEARNLQHRDFQLIDGKPMLHIRGTKTKNSDRYVPCPPDLYAKYSKSSFDNIFKTSRGTNISDEKYRRLCERLYREMNISMGCKLYRNQLVPPFPLAEDFVPYNLRHTYCSNLARSGIKITTAQKLMGHSTIQLTANIYTHIQQDDISEAYTLLYSGCTDGCTNF